MYARNTWAATFIRNLVIYFISNLIRQSPSHNAHVVKGSKRKRWRRESRPSTSWSLNLCLVNFRLAAWELNWSASKMCLENVGFVDITRLYRPAKLSSTFFRPSFSFFFLSISFCNHPMRVSPNYYSVLWFSLFFRSPLPSPLKFPIHAVLSYTTSLFFLKAASPRSVIRRFLRKRREKSFFVPFKITHTCLELNVSWKLIHLGKL